jgi:hypothetical protein
MKPVVLFDKWDNKLNAGATLSEPVQNFSRVELMFKTDDNDIFTEAVLQPTDYAVVVASCAKWNSHSELYVKSKTFTVRGMSVSTAQDSGTGNYMCGQRNLTNGQQTFGDFITIVKAVGWR